MPLLAKAYHRKGLTLALPKADSAAKMLWQLSFCLMASGEGGAPEKRPRRRSLSCVGAQAASAEEAVPAEEAASAEAG